MLTRRALFPAATALFAADPWKGKAPAEWSDDDARKVLTKSPWAKDTTVEMAGGAMGGMGGGGTLGPTNGGSNSAGSSRSSTPLLSPSTKPRAKRSAILRLSSSVSASKAASERTISRRPEKGFFRSVAVVGIDRTSSTRVGESLRFVMEEENDKRRLLVYPVFLK